MNKEHRDQFITEALAIEARDAKEAGALGYMGRAFVQATMPHSKVNGNEFIRKNGNFTLTMLAPSETGLPFGSVPRLLLAWIATEAVRTKSKELILGRSLSDFMTQLSLVPTGGRWGSITRLKDQMMRLFSTHISCTYDSGEQWAIKNVTPVSQSNLWWDPKNPNQPTLFESALILGDEFFNEIINFPIPIDMDALKALKRSPMALDIYCWLTYRMSYLNRRVEIPWSVLQVQFGANYASDSQGVRNFKRHFLQELTKVNCIYSAADVENGSYGLILKPSQTHIPKL